MRIPSVLAGTLGGLLWGGLFAPAIGHFPGEYLLDPLWYTLTGTAIGLFVDLTRSPVNTQFMDAISFYRCRHPLPADGRFLAELERDCRDTNGDALV